MSSPKTTGKRPKQKQLHQPVELQDAELEAAAGAGTAKLMEACADGTHNASHTSGVNAVFGDGSVRTLSSSVGS